MPKLSFLTEMRAAARRLVEQHAPRRLVLRMRKRERNRQQKQYDAKGRPGTVVDTGNSGLFICNNRPAGSQATLLVLGSGRGGTSLVAGVLYHMGIFLGDECMRPSYEDQKLSRDIYGASGGNPRDTIDDYSSRFDVWGYKQPQALSFIMRHHDQFVEPRLVIVVKDVAAIAVRKVFVLGGDPIDYMYLALEDYQRILRFVSRSKLPAMIASYEKIIADPASFIDALADFAGADVSAEGRAAGLSFVQKGNEEYKAFSLAKRNERLSEFCSHLDVVTTRQVAGWVASLATPEPVDVVLTVDGVEVARVLADTPREDVKDAGFHPTGQCGFQFDLPEDAPIAPGATVRVLIGDDALDVAGSPKIVSG